MNAHITGPAGTTGVGDPETDIAIETPSGTIQTPTPPGRRQMLTALATDFRALPVLVALLALVIFFSTQSDVFLSSRNISNLLVQTVVTGTIALGLVFILLVAEIDLSVAAISGVTSVLMAKLVVESGLPGWLAIVSAISVGVLIGILTATWATRFLVPTFVVTLGLGLVLNGIQLALLPESGRYSLLGTGIEDIAGTYLTGIWSWGFLLVAVVAVAVLALSRYRRNRAFGIDTSLVRVVVLPVAAMTIIGGILVLALNSSQGVPLPVVIFMVLLGLAGYLLSETRFGLHLYAVGGNVDAAARSGISVGRIKVIAFGISGGLAALAGVIAASRLLGVSVASGGGIGGGALLLNSIAAAVIGGVSLFGGRGRASSALLGALVIGTVSNGLNLMGVETQVQLVVTGVLLVLAVTLDRTIERATGPTTK
ncbi:sugar ABC transporter permease [Micromonospora sp. DT81.3]|uniref:sugar ABC transporter permease n=1 Tax=Micromonospora sp. DT81.3 TaxID=3416523 RepID=UPI003CF65788